MSALKLSFIIEAIDRATAPVRAVNERIGKVTEPIRKVRASVNALVQESGLSRIADQAGVVAQKFQGVTGALRGIGAAGLVAGAGAAAMWFPIKRAIDQGSKINDTAAMLGVSAREFQRLSYALTLDGSSAEDAATSLRFLQKNAVDALTGSKEMSVWFRRAGMSGQFLKANLNDPIAMVHRLSDAMAKNESPAKRIALMQNLLGRGGARNAQTLARGATELRRLGDEAEELNAVLDNDTVEAFDAAGDSLTRAERALGGLVNAVVATALPVVNRISKDTIAWAIANRTLIASRVGEFVDRLVRNLPQIVDTTMRIVGAIGSAILVMDKIAQAMGGWNVVINLVAVVLGGKLLLAVISFGVALGKLTMIVGNFLIAIAPVVAIIAPWLVAIGLLAVAAVMLYRNWAPIAEFFTNLWDDITSAATSGVAAIMSKVNAVVAFVQSAILKLDSVTPDWVKKWTLPGAALAAVANAVRPAATAPAALPGAAGARADVGGTINIKLDQDGRARVAGMHSENPNVDFDVDSGLMFGGA